MDFEFSEDQATIRRAVADCTERYVQKDRCPADDQLEGAR